MNGYETQRLAVALMREHGLMDDRFGDRPWRVKLDTAKRRFGRCDYSPRIIRISAAMAAVNDEPDVRDVILHEIAHALTPGAGHGLRWKLKCMEIGARPQRYAAEHMSRPPAPWRLACPIPGCPTGVDRFRRTSGPVRFGCRAHDGTALVWERKGR